MQSATVPIGVPTIFARPYSENAVVIDCPYCGHEHVHGKVGIPGHRVPDCGTNSTAGYMVVLPSALQ